MQKQYTHDSTEYLFCKSSGVKWIIKLHFYKLDFYWPVPLDYGFMHAAFI